MPFAAQAEHSLFAGLRGGLRRQVFDGMALRSGIERTAMRDGALAVTEVRQAASRAPSLDRGVPAALIPAAAPVWPAPSPSSSCGLRRDLLPDRAVAWRRRALGAAGRFVDAHHDAPEFLDELQAGVGDGGSLEIAADKLTSFGIIGRDRVADINMKPAVLPAADEICGFRFDFTGCFQSLKQVLREALRELLDVNGVQRLENVLYVLMMTAEPRQGRAFPLLFQRLLA